jgi:hypothetical protein
MQFGQLKRREFISLLGGAAATWPFKARAQKPGKLPLIGVLVSASPPHPFADAFWRGLHALGYSEGRNIKVEFRYTDARSDRAEEYAEELAAKRLDELRNAWLNPPDLIDIVPEVVPGYPDRILPKNQKAAAELKNRTLTNLYNQRPQWAGRCARRSGCSRCRGLRVAGGYLRGGCAGELA